jgi:glutathione synthase/RimK-type ligase-like ATP-grasp enzyme
MGNIRLCIMWSCSLNWGKEKPYTTDYRNEKYGLFAEVAARQGIDVFLAEVSWYKGNGRFKQGWFFDPDVKVWTKARGFKADVVYDKSSVRKLDKKKRVAKKVPVVNHWKIEVVCKDKLETYRLFKDYVPNTIRITSKDSLLNALDLLPGHMVVLKPIGGSRGKGVQVVRKELVREGKVKLEKKSEYVAQQFVMSARGIPSLGIEGRHDLRVIVANGRPVLSYVRVAKKGMFVANLALGGESVHLPRKDIPRDVLRVVKDEGCGQVV